MLKYKTKTQREAFDKAMLKVLNKQDLTKTKRKVKVVSQWLLILSLFLSVFLTFALRSTVGGIIFCAFIIEHAVFKGKLLKVFFKND